MLLNKINLGNNCTSSFYILKGLEEKAKSFSKKAARFFYWTYFILLISFILIIVSAFSATLLGLKMLVRLLITLLFLVLILYEIHPI